MQKSKEIVLCLEIEPESYISAQILVTVNKRDLGNMIPFEIDSKKFNDKCKSRIYYLQLPPEILIKDLEKEIRLKMKLGEEKLKATPIKTIITEKKLFI